MTVFNDLIEFLMFRLLFRLLLLSLIHQVLINALNNNIVDII